MFHHFHGGRHPKGQGSISEADFDRLLNHIGIERILSPSEWLYRMERGGLQNSDLCLTFDDGLLCQKEVALPVLENYNLKAFWFVYSSVFEGKLENLEIYRMFRTKYFESIDDFYELFFQKAATSLGSYETEIKSLKRQFPFYTEKDIRFRILRDKVLGKSDYEGIMDELLKDFDCDKPALAKNLWMTNEDLRFLSGRGDQIGLHSYSHPTRLEGLPCEIQKEEYRKNYDHLKRVCGQGPVSMSHPCNSYNEETLGILREFGIHLGFRSNMFPKRRMGMLNLSVWELAREDHANIRRTLGQLEIDKSFQIR